MEKKFELVLETEKEFFGIKMFRVRALISFSCVKKGDLSGYIEKENNLSQFGDAWVSGNACVFGDARVFGNACVFGDARVSGDACVSGNARVSGDACVFGDARVSGDAWVKKINQCINILNLQFPITLTPQNIQIGCHLKTHKEWLKVTKKEAVKMGLKSKNYLLFKNLIKLLMKEVKK